MYRPPPPPSSSASQFQHVEHKVSSLGRGHERTVRSLLQSQLGRIASFNLFHLKFLFSPPFFVICSAYLVPVFSFGENELFKQVSNPEGSLLRTVQNKLQKVMGFALPLFHARGIFQYNFGLVPYRKPIHTVGTYIKDERLGKTSRDVNFLWAAVVLIDWGTNAREVASSENFLK